MKNTYIITYDIPDGEDYPALYEYFKSHGTWAHVAESVWAIKTEKSAETIREEVLGKVSSTSTVFVIKSGVEAAWSNVVCRNQWLLDNL